MATVRRTTAMPVWTRRFGSSKNLGSSESRAFDARCSSLTLVIVANRPLFVCDALQPLQRPAHRQRRRLEVRLALPDGQHERGAGQQVGHVMLAEIDEREPER